MVGAPLAVVGQEGLVAVDATRFLGAPVTPAFLCVVSLAR